MEICLILASNSPRRRQLLGLITPDFKVIPADVDETPRGGETPTGYVTRLAVEKATHVAVQVGSGCLVVAADTTVVDGNQILGKPANQAEAARMLRQLRGRVHQVHTGVAVAYLEGVRTVCCSTQVPMRNYRDEEIQAYIASGDPLDKAGAYAIQHAEFHPVGELKGCFANVMGLPLCHLAALFHELGVPLGDDVPQACQEFLAYDCPISGMIPLAS